jgi:hypothetical protein
MTTWTTQEVVDRFLRFRTDATEKEIGMIKNQGVDGAALFSIECSFFENLGFQKLRAHSLMK